MYCERHNQYYYLNNECSSCKSTSSLFSSLSNSYSSSDSLFASTKDKSSESYDPLKYLEKSKTNAEPSVSLFSPPEKPKYLSGLPELHKPFYKPPEFPKPVNNVCGDMLGYREKDTLGRDTFRPVMGGGTYQVAPSVFGNSYVRDYRGNLVGQMSQGPLGSDTLFPPPDFGPSFRR